MSDKKMVWPLTDVEFDEVFAAIPKMPDHRLRELEFRCMEECAKRKLPRPLESLRLKVELKTEET